jgi:hypothetical protein
MIRFNSALCSQLMNPRNVDKVINAFINNPGIINRVRETPQTISFQSNVNEIDVVYAIDYISKDILVTDSRPSYVDIQYYVSPLRKKSETVISRVLIDEVSKSYPQVFVYMERSDH